MWSEIVSKVFKPLIVIVLATMVLGLSACTSSPSPSSAPTTTKPHPPPVPIIKVPVSVANTSDGQVSFRETGYGTPLVMIMGFSGSMDAWTPDFIDALAQHFRVIIFDNAGIGKTTMPSGKFTMDTMARQTDALIHSLNLGKPDVLGWSMGGMIAQDLAATYPDDVNKLVLCATLPGNGKATLPPASVVSKLGNPSASQVLTMMGLIFPADQPNAASNYIHQIVEYPNFYIADTAVNQDQLDALGLWSLGGMSSGKAISSVKAPTLIADGEDDLLIPTPNAYELHSVLKNSQVLLYPDAGHAFLFQDQNQFAPSLISFLNS